MKLICNQIGLKQLAIHFLHASVHACISSYTYIDLEMKLIIVHVTNASIGVVVMTSRTELNKRKTSLAATSSERVIL